MQQGLKSMWKSKEVPDYRTTTYKGKINKSDKKKFIKSFCWVLGLVVFIILVQVVWLW